MSKKSSSTSSTTSVTSYASSGTSISTPSSTVMGICPLKLEICKGCKSRYQCQFYWFTFDHFKKYLASMDLNILTIKLPGFWISKILDTVNSGPPCMLSSDSGFNFEVIIEAFKAGELWHGQKK